MDCHAGAKLYENKNLVTFVSYSAMCEVHTRTGKNPRVAQCSPRGRISQGSPLVLGHQGDCGKGHTLFKFFYFDLFPNLHFLPSPLSLSPPPPSPSASFPSSLSVSIPRVPGAHATSTSISVSGLPHFPPTFPIYLSLSLSHMWLRL